MAPNDVSRSDANTIDASRSSSSSSASSITGVTQIPVAETSTINEKQPRKGVEESSPPNSTQNSNDNQNGNHYEKDGNKERDPYEVFLTDEENPTNLPLLRKWWIVLVVCTCATCVTCSSSMAASSFPQIQSQFHIGTEVAILSISLFILGLGLGPLVFGGLSEFLGRNLIYRGSFAAFCLLNFPVAFSNNAAVFLIFRFLTGFAGSAFLSVGGGSIADLFVGAKVLTPVAIYSLSPFIGPSLGPVVSGFINQYTTWRWTYYVQIIWSFIQVVLLHTIPETYAPTLINRKAERLRRETSDPRYFSPHDTKGRSMRDTLKMSIYRPFVLIATEMMVLLLNMWTSLILAIIYITFSQFAVIFGEVHGFSEHQVGLSFLGLGLGMVLGTCTQPIWNGLDRRKTAHYEKLGERPPPEIALYSAMVAAVLAPIGLYMFAFTVYKQVHWIAPILCIIPFGMAAVLAFTSTFTYLVRVYRPVAASAMASNSFMRSCLAGAFPLASRPMFKAMTNTGALAFLAGVMTLMAPLPFVFFKYGPQIRKNSKYAV